jgi:hypothetical protein
MASKMVVAGKEGQDELGVAFTTSLPSAHNALHRLPDLKELPR